MRPCLTGKSTLGNERWRLDREVFCKSSGALMDVVGSKGEVLKRRRVSL